MLTAENILVMKTLGTAADLVDSPELLKVVEEVRNGLRSPLVDLTEHLKGAKQGNKKWSGMHKNSFLAKVLCMKVMRKSTDSTKVLVFNEAKLPSEKLSRLWCLDCPVSQNGKDA